MSESNNNNSKFSTIEITTRTLVEMEQALALLGQAKGLPVKIAYRISRLIAKIQPEFESYNQTRQAIFKELGEEAENGQLIIKKENVEEFNKRINSVLDDEMVKFDFIKLNLDDIEKVELSAFDIGRLYPLLNEPDE